MSHIVSIQGRKSFNENERLFGASNNRRHHMILKICTFFLIFRLFVSFLSLFSNCTMAIASSIISSIEQVILLNLCPMRVSADHYQFSTKTV
jgi:Fe2+ transport system protein B